MTNKDYNNFRSSTVDTKIDTFDATLTETKTKKGGVFGKNCAVYWLFVARHCFLQAWTWLWFQLWFIFWLIFGTVCAFPSAHALTCFPFISRVGEIKERKHRDTFYRLFLLQAWTWLWFILWLIFGTVCALPSAHALTSLLSSRV